MSARHTTGLASIVLFPIVGALRLAGIVDSLPYALVAIAALLFLACSLVEPIEPFEPRETKITPPPPRSPLLH